MHRYLSVCGQVPVHRRTAVYILYLLMRNINLISLNRLALPKSDCQKIGNNESDESLPSFYQGEKFLKGPIPWNWLCRASCIPGRAFHVAIRIWHLAGLYKGKKTFALSQKILRELGLKRTTAYRGIASLEAEGLIKVERNPGRNSIVTILGIKANYSSKELKE